MNSDAIERVKAAVAGLPEGLRQHTEGVAAEAVGLARRCGVDQERAALAAWAHDIARPLPPLTLLAHAQEFGWTIEPVEAAVPLLLHGPVGAELLRRQHGITDEGVLAAVRYHTFGHAAMTPLEKVILLADKVEASQTWPIEDLPGVRALAAQGALDGAILSFLSQLLLAQVRGGRAVHPQLVAARNHLLLTQT